MLSLRLFLVSRFECLEINVRHVYLQEVGSIIGKKGEIVKRFREEVSLNSHGRGRKFKMADSLFFVIESP